MSIQATIGQFINPSSGSFNRMPVNIDQELDRIPNIDRYPALSAARGTAILYPVEPTIKDEAEMVKLSLYTNHKSTTHERTAALELSVKLGCPTCKGTMRH